MNILSPETGSKKMNKNVLIVLAGAVLSAVLVALLVQMSLGGKKEVSEPGEGVQVLVAAKDLKIGHELAEGDMRWRSWPENTLFKGAITRKDEQAPEEALEGRLERSFAQGEAMVRKAILVETKANIVAARLKDGERAVSIKVAEEDLVAGFISPGSYVDVILTYDDRISFGNERGAKEDNSDIEEMIALNLKKWATETILDNVRVLALNQQTESSDSDSKTNKLGKKATVTLAVPIRDAEKLSLASEMGKITLALRGVGDDAANESAPVITDSRLSSIDDEIHAEYKELQKKSGGDMNKVKIYNGAQVQSVPVR